MTKLYYSLPSFTLAGCCSNLYYSDGSVLNTVVVSAFYDATRNFTKIFRLWNQATIYPEVPITIIQSLKYLSEKISPYKQAIILMDCLIVLSKFTNIQPSCAINSTEARIDNTIWNLQNKRICVHFYWTM